MKARKLKLGINMDNGWMYHASRNSGQGPITLGVMFLSRFSHLCIYLTSVKHFCNTFLGNYESQKAETWYNGWMYPAYQKRGQGPIALGVISLSSIFFFSIYYAFCLSHSVLVDLLQGNLYHTCSAG